MKRLFDIAFSLGALLFFSPLLLLLSLLIKSSSKGPLLFSQERVGLHGKPFRLYKLRTMVPDAEERLSTLLATSPSHLNEWKSCYKLKEDPRITSIGKFLRATSLDELPQFWNVLKGEMSIVGPRPVTARELQEEYGRYAAKLLQVRPGLTGPWQLSGRSNVSYKKRISLDMHYIRFRTFCWDLSLTLRTIPEMLFPKGAY